MEANEELKNRIALVTAEKSRRQSEALRLYRPMPNQSKFHESLASERIIRGGNRSGKSMSAFAETASAATGIPITIANGVVLPYKYSTRHPLAIWVIGYDQRHVGGTIHRMLFQEGAFQIITDEKTGEWRAWRPWEEYDAAYEEKTKNAPPLIPSRMIRHDQWAWENKAERVFSVCRLVNGTEIHAFSSKAEPKQGDPVDLIHIDEDIEYSKHVSEWQARLSDRKGRLIWSVWPHSRNDALIRMSERAEDQKHDEEPDVHEIVLRFSDNPFIDKKEKDKRIEAWSKIGPEEVRARDKGEFVTDTFLVYPNFTMDVHGIPGRTPEEDDHWGKIVRENGNRPPDDWTRLLVLDPGHVVCAILFAAVPPPSKGKSDTIVLYDELYLRRLDADGVAQQVHQKVSGKSFEVFLIDNRAGRQTPMGFNKTVRQQYADAFERYAIRSRQSGSNFVPGSDNIAAGIGLVREWLTIRNNGTTKLRVMRDRTTNLQKEFLLYKKRVTRDAISDDPVPKNDHLMDALRYLASYSPEYVPPRMVPSTMSPAMKHFKEWKKAGDGKEEEFFAMGPGTAK